MTHKEQHLEIEKCTELTQQLCALFKTDATEAELESPTMDTLRFLWDQSNLLYDLVKGRPEELGRSGHVRPYQSAGKTWA